VRVSKATCGPRSPRISNRAGNRARPPAFFRGRLLVSGTGCACFGEGLNETAHRCHVDRWRAWEDELCVVAGRFPANSVRWARCGGCE
jgi:hypothetical protein